MATTKESLNIYQRLHNVMRAVGYIQKEKKAGMQYSTVSHDAVTAKVRPELVKHGVVYHPVALEFAQEGNRTEVKLTVRFVNIDNPQDYIDVPSLGYGIDNQDKGPGKAVSYAVKYALLKALGLETGDDPDSDQHVTYQPAKVVSTVELASVQQLKLIGTLMNEQRITVTAVEEHFGKNPREMTKAEASEVIQYLSGTAAQVSIPVTDDLSNIPWSPREEQQ